MSSHDIGSPTHCNPPRNVSTDPADAWQTAATANVATSTDLWASYTSADGTVGPPKGKVWVEFETAGFTVFIRCTRTATTGTTIANGSYIDILHVADNRFYLDPTKDLFLDHISPGGVGTIKWRVCGQIVERNRI